uniref:Uncharacterized protein n=1 Tax=Ackermannviridae sp. TaxID=2831612 RepID=A0A8S5VXN9_9CAUD|nr:MAG TPA: hypothetical protein [Ackermannviridae sp.]
MATAKLSHAMRSCGYAIHREAVAEQRRAMAKP